MAERKIVPGRVLIGANMGLEDKKYDNPIRGFKFLEANLRLLEQMVVLNCSHAKTYGWGLLDLELQRQRDTALLEIFWLEGRETVVFNMAHGIPKAVLEEGV